MQKFLFSCYRNWEIITTFAFEQTMLLRLVVVVNLCFLHQGAAY